MKRQAQRLFEIQCSADVKALEAPSDPDFITITGKASTFGNVDQVGDIIRHGAFAEDIAEKKRDRAMRGDDYLMPMLMNHDSWSSDALPIGKVVDLEETEDSLMMTGKIPWSDDRTRRIKAQLVDATSIRGLSIGFYILQQDREGNNRIIEKIRLREISLTPFPANELAIVLSAKSQGMQDGLSFTLEHALTLQARENETRLRAMGFAKSLAIEFASFIESKRRDSVGSGDRRDSDPMDIGNRPLDQRQAALLKALSEG